MGGEDAQLKKRTRGKASAGLEELDRAKRGPKNDNKEKV
jgi:hypothetical protein